MSVTRWYCDGSPAWRRVAGYVPRELVERAGCKQITLYTKQIHYQTLFSIKNHYEITLKYT